MGGNMRCGALCGSVARALGWITGTILVTFASAVAADPYNFDSDAYLGEARLMPEWANTLKRQSTEDEILSACLLDSDTCPNKYRGVRHLLVKAQSLTKERQIKLVNHYVNNRRYRRDRTAHLVTPLSDEPVKYRSRWATVNDFLTRGGDCEDFATTKYFLLRRLGVEAQQMRVVVAYDRQARGYHAVLAVLRDNGKIWLLDSDGYVRSSGRNPYRYIYAVNELSIWDHETKKEIAS